MSKLTKIKISQLIKEELDELMDEEALLAKHDEPGYIGRKIPRTPQLACKVCGDVHGCPECGGYHDEYNKCGGHISSVEAILAEDCGCSRAVTDHDADNDFIPDLEYTHPSQGHILVDDITELDPDSAYGIGFMTGQSGEFDDDVKIGNHNHYKGSYMAKSQMHKVAKYAQKLYKMIPDGHNLEDWMRTKLAQIADDIGEVYHALDDDIHKGDV